MIDLVMKMFKMGQSYAVKKRKEENIKAVDEAMNEGDQKKIEEAMGSSNAGKPTKHRIPGLRKRPTKN